jgi:hypothetical protein
MAKEHEKESKAVKAPKAPKAKDPAREAQKAKRLAQIKELQAKEPLKFYRRVNFKEAKVLQLKDKAGKVIESWKQFCAAKSAWDAEFWTAAATKPMASEKSIERKKLAFQKLKERLAKYQAELEGIISADAK